MTAVAGHVDGEGRADQALNESALDQLAERSRKLDLLMNVCGIVNSPELITDEDDERILYEEMTRRHG